MDEQRLTVLIRDLYRIVGDLETMFPGRRFTPDGHLVGSLGECLVAHHYGVALYPSNQKGHDGTCDGHEVQIKATQGARVGLTSEPRHLIVVQLNRQGGFVEVYNGPGGPVWNLVKHKPPPSNGQFTVAVSKLRELMLNVSVAERLPTRAGHAVALREPGQASGVLKHRPAQSARGDAQV